MKLPNHLRKKRNMRFFQGKRKRGRKEPSDCMSVELDLGPERIEFLDYDLRTMRVTEWQGIEQHVLRRGTSPAIPGAIEAVTCSEHLLTGKNYRWDLLVKIEKRYIYVTCFGPGEFGEYEKEWEAVIKSIRLK